MLIILFIIFILYVVYYLFFNYSFSIVLFYVARRAGDAAGSNISSSIHSEYTRSKYCTSASSTCSYALSNGPAPRGGNSAPPPPHVAAESDPHTQTVVYRTNEGVGGEGEEGYDGEGEGEGGEEGGKFEGEGGGKGGGGGRGGRREGASERVMTATQTMRRNLVSISLR